jgi:O-methyltransferase
MSDAAATERYIELLKRALTGEVHEHNYTLQGPYLGPRRLLHYVAADMLRGVVRRRGIEPVRRADPERLRTGKDWPLVGETMIGRARMDNIQACVETVISEAIPGDLIETGVWRGGASIFMRGLLAAHGVSDRTVWVADSFRGLPPPDERYPQDAGDHHHTVAALAVSLASVRGSFERYGLLDDQVRFLEGWFKDTLPTVRDVRWAVVRLDGDMYESTMDGLVNLYPNLSPGGYLIVDDFNLGPCRAAVADYREQHGITEPIADIDRMGAYWRKAAA